VKSARLATGAVLATAAIAIPTLAGASSNGTEIDRSANAITVAVLADTPYGAAQRPLFGAMIDDVNADAKVRRVVHLGDLKSGSTPCSNDYLQPVLDQLARLEDPLVYTPGDNEWTDCHRPAAGGFDPLERLAHIRSSLFPVPGQTLGGRSKSVITQAETPHFAEYVENVLWFESRVAFATVHVVGSNNGYDAWTNETPAQTVARIAEADSRTAAAIAWINATFDLAARENAAGVALLMQADMWDAFSVANNLPLTGFDKIVATIGARSVAFGKPVLILQGDSHSYLSDRPFIGAGEVHGYTTRAPNVVRIVAPGATVTQWLRLTVDPRDPAVFAWTVENV
jgi:hypothetical protein